MASYKEADMKSIKIERNNLGDSRTADRVPTFDEFNESNILHRLDVKSLLNVVASELQLIGWSHDFTKTEEPERSLFYRELCEAIEGRMDFLDGEWLKLHYETERHHLKERCPEDVNLLDVLEMIADCVCAGKARSGEVREMEIDADILERAFQNTVKLFDEAVEIKEE